MVHGNSGSGADEGQRNPEGGNGFDVQAAVQQAEQHRRGRADLVNDEQFRGSEFSISPLPFVPAYRIWIQ